MSVNACLVDDRVMDLVPVPADPAVLERKRDQLVDRVPSVRGIVGRTRCRPDLLYGDRGYDSQGHRRKLRQRGTR